MKMKMIIKNKPSLKMFKGIEILFVLILIFIGLSIFAPNFFRISNMFNVARQIATLGIVSVAMTFVLIAGGIDLSAGYTISMVNVVCAWLMTKGGMHPVLAVIMVILMGTAIGCLNGLIIIKTYLPPMIVTLSMMNILNGLSYMISGGLPIFGFPEGFKVIGQGTIFGSIPISLIIMVVIFALGSFILNKTSFGRYCYAMGSNEEATRFSGVNTEAVRILAHTICGFLTAIGGVVLLSRANSGQSSSGATYSFQVITACVLGGVSVKGGKGTIFNVTIGVLIVGFLNNGLVLLGASEYTQLVINGTLMLVAVSYDTLSRTRSERIKRIKAINADNIITNRFHTFQKFKAGK